MFKLLTTEKPQRGDILLSVIDWRSLSDWKKFLAGRSIYKQAALYLGDNKGWFVDSRKSHVQVLHGTYHVFRLKDSPVKVPDFAEHEAQGDFNWLALPWHSVRLLSKCDLLNPEVLSVTALQDLFAYHGYDLSSGPTFDALLSSNNLRRL